MLLLHCIQIRAEMHFNRGDKIMKDSAKTVIGAVMVVIGFIMSVYAHLLVRGQIHAGFWNYKFKMTMAIFSDDRARIIFLVGALLLLAGYVIFSLGSEPRKKRKIQ